MRFLIKIHSNKNTYIISFYVKTSNSVCLQTITSNDQRGRNSHKSPCLKHTRVSESTDYSSFTILSNIRQKLYTQMAKENKKRKEIKDCRSLKCPTPHINVGDKGLYFRTKLLKSLQSFPVPTKVWQTYIERVFKPGSLLSLFYERRVEGLLTDLPTSIYHTLNLYTYDLVIGTMSSPRIRRGINCLSSHLSFTCFTQTSLLQRSYIKIEGVQEGVLSVKCTKRPMKTSYFSTKQRLDFSVRTS